MEDAVKRSFGLPKERRLIVWANSWVDAPFFGGFFAGAVISNDATSFAS
jgi:hypothetical protein